MLSRDRPPRGGLPRQVCMADWLAALEAIADMREDRPAKRKRRKRRKKRQPMLDEFQRAAIEDIPF